MKNCFSPVHRNRNAIERMFSRLKDFRRIATRYDRLAHNFLAAVCLACKRQLWIAKLEDGALAITVEANNHANSEQTSP